MNKNLTVIKVGCVFKGSTITSGNTFIPHGFFSITLFVIPLVWSYPILCANIMFFQNRCAFFFLLCSIFHIFHMLRVIHDGYILDPTIWQPYHRANTVEAFFHVSHKINQMTETLSSKPPIQIFSNLLSV